MIEVIRRVRQDKDALHTYLELTLGFVALLVICGLSLLAFCVQSQDCPTQLIKLLNP